MGLSPSARPCTAVPPAGHLVKQFPTGLHFHQAVAAELLDQRRGDFKGHDVLDDHAGGRHGADVAPFVAGLFRLLGRQVDRLQRFAQRADRLLGGADHQRLAVGHARLQPAGIVRGADVAQVRLLGLCRVVMNRVVHLRAGPPGRLESQADLHALDRLHGHHGLRQTAVELAVPLGMRAQAERQPLDAHLDDAAQRVAFLPLGVDQLLDGRVAVGVERIDLAGVAQLSLRFERAGLGLDAQPAQLDDVAEGRDAERRQQLLGQRAGRHADRRFAGAGPFEHAADRPQELDRAGQIAVAGPRALQVVEPLELGVLVDHLQGDRAAERLLVPDAAEDLDLIGLDPLPAAASVAPLATAQLAVDRLGFDFHSGRKAVDQGQQGLAVRLAGGPVTQHGLSSATESFCDSSNST